MPSQVNRPYLGSIVPHHAGALSNRSLAFEKTGRLDMAERDLRILLGVLPDANTHLRLASVYRSLGELDKAEKTLDEAAARHPSSAKVFLDRGNCKIAFLGERQPHGWLLSRS